MRIKSQEFDELVSTAIAGIEEQFRRYLEEVPVIVEDRPDAAAARSVGLSNPRHLLGLFRGVPLKLRSVEHSGVTNQILLYRRNILSVCRTRAELAQQIRATIIHELGHYLGFSEAELRRHHY